MNIIKRCSKCLEVKSIPEFHRHSSGKKGPKSYCKLCDARIKREIRAHGRPSTRQCRRCHTEKTLTDFVQDSKGRARWSTICKECKVTAERGRYSRKAAHVRDLDAKYEALRATFIPLSPAALAHYRANHAANMRDA